MRSRKKTTSFDGKIAVPAANVEMWPISKLHDHPMNPRTHPPAQLALLGSLIKKFGFYKPIIADEQGTILAGHGARAAAALIGMDELPVVVQNGLSEAEKMGMIFSDNQTGLLSGWNQDLAHAGVTMLKTEGYDLQLLGFGESQLVQFTTTPGPPAAFQSVDQVKTSYCCPKCGFEWSGLPKPKVKEPRKSKKKNGKAK